MRFDTFMKELDGIQESMVVMEGMIDVLISGAYNDADAANIGNSLEVLRHYLDERAERLDLLLMNAKAKIRGGGNGEGIVHAKTSENICPCMGKNG